MLPSELLSLWSPMPVEEDVCPNVSVLPYFICGLTWNQTSPFSFFISALAVKDWLYCLPLFSWRLTMSPSCWKVVRSRLLPESMSAYL